MTSSEQLQGRGATPTERIMCVLEYSRPDEVLRRQSRPGIQGTGEITGEELGAIGTQGIRFSCSTRAGADGRENDIKWIAPRYKAG